MDIPIPPLSTAAFETVADGYHLPVMLPEVIEALCPQEGHLIVDGTLGGGGHSQALMRKGAKIIGLDQDGGAIGYCIQHLVVYDGDTVRIKQANFRDLSLVLQELKISKVDGILLDLGVSSAQLDRAERGFSFQKAGPLDMRMDQRSDVDAAELVNKASAEELTHIFRVYGEEPAARRIVAAIVAKRQNTKLTDTLALADLVESVVPRHGPRHPATRVFQALRIAVNDELGAVKQALEASVQHLHPGGRLAVITFHSLEDRLVKNFCRDTTAPMLDRPEWPAPKKNPRYVFRAVSRRALQPSAEEQLRNPRSRSAKLRILERVD